jgi:hypothetical protein
MIDLTRFVEELGGATEWGEAALYAACLGLRLVLDDETPDTRLQWDVESAYQGGVTTSHIGAGLIFINEQYHPDPEESVVRHKRLFSICCEATHEAMHHLLKTTFDDDVYGGEYETLDRLLSLEMRQAILRQLDAEVILREAGIPQENLTGHWTASSREILQREREEAVERGDSSEQSEEDVQSAAVHSAQEFLCQLGGCLAWHRIRKGRRHVSLFVESLKANGILPPELPPLVTRVISLLEQEGAENAALADALEAINQTSTSEYLEVREQAIAAGEWPSDLSKGVALTRLPIYRN